MIQSGNLYADLSSYYDLFCAEVDYAEQCDFTKRAFDCFASSGGLNYLDLACGTGAHIELMQLYGFKATGLDNSAEMLRLAASRCPRADFVCSDMSELETSDAYDLISCFLYSIHYSYPVSNLKLTLRRAYDALKPGGVFIFNTVDIKGVTSRHFVNTQVRTENKLLTFVSGWTYPGQGEAMDLSLSISIRSPAGTGSEAPTQHWHDRHTMVAIDIRDLEIWLKQVGFEVTLLEHDYTRLRPWAGDSFNFIVVAHKPGELPPG